MRKKQYKLFKLYCNIPVNTCDTAAWVRIGFRTGKVSDFGTPRTPRTRTAVLRVFHG